jgi:hypothetical protein
MRGKNRDGQEVDFVETVTPLPSTRAPRSVALAELPATLGLSEYDDARDVARISNESGQLLEAHRGPVRAIDSLGNLYDVAIVTGARGRYLKFSAEVKDSAQSGLYILLHRPEMTEDELRTALCAYVNRLGRVQLEELAQKTGVR